MSGSNAMIAAESQDIAQSAHVGPGSSVRARRLVLAPDASIGANVVIDAEVFVLGRGASIGDNARVSGIRGRSQRVEIGDHSSIGDSSSVLVPEFVVGDYVTIHHHLLCNGYKACLIGHNTWIGQNCVLNSTDALTIGNNVGIGAYSSLYTHAYHGELLEGCQTFVSAPIVIEDNAWLVGSYNVISPGVTVGSKAMVLTSSVVTHDVPVAGAVGGVPAKDLSDRINGFRDPSVTEKVEMMRSFVAEFVVDRYDGANEEAQGGYWCAPADREPFFVVVQDQFDAALLPGPHGAVYAGASNDRSSNEVTIFNIGTKMYGKTSSAFEAELIKYMNGYRARFVPEDRPRVC